MSLESIATGLEQSGLAVVPDFLTPEQWQGLATEAAALNASGDFRPARIGRSSNENFHQEIRSDSILWLDPLTLSPAQRPVWALLETLRTHLNRQFFLGLRWFECHLAVYPAGARYAKHLDRFQDHSARTVTFVLYLNHNWTPADGGSLRLFDRNQPDTLIKEILPIGGTLTCFMSGEIPHEVLSPSRPRYSLTGWFRTDQPP
jgi:SM-20-related protein